MFRQSQSENRFIASTRGSIANPKTKTKISGPLLERINLHVEVPRLPPADLRPDAPPGERSIGVVVRMSRRRHASLYPLSEQ